MHVKLCKEVTAVRRVASGRWHGRGCMAFFRGHEPLRCGGGGGSDAQPAQGVCL